MPFRIEFAKTRPAKFIKKASEPFKSEIISYLKEIAENPQCSGSLSGEFKDLLCYHFSSKGVQYRIVYEVNQEENIVGIIHIGTRENFYKELKQIFG